MSALHRRLLPISLAALLPLLAEAALGPRYGGDVTVGVPDLPSRREPEVPYGSGPGLYQSLAHETLVDLDDEGLPVPALAEGWSGARDGLSWTFTLRDGALFHDGSRVTSADVVRSLRRFLRGPSAAAAALAADLAGGGSEDSPRGVQAADSRRVVLRFDRAPARLLSVLSAPAAAVTSATGAGAGPFVPTLVTGDRLTLTAFGAHVRGRPFLDSVTLVAGPPTEALDAELRARRLDLAPVAAEGSRLAATLLLVLEAGQAPFDRPATRAAFAAALPVGPLFGRFLAVGEANPRLLPRPLLPAIGRVPLPTASTRGLPADIALVVDREVPPLLSQRVVAFLGSTGARVTVRSLSAAAAREGTGQWPVRLLLFRPEVADAALALRELQALAGPGPAAAAIEAAAREPDPTRRVAGLTEAEVLLRGSGVLIPLGSLPISYRARPGLHDVRVDPSGRLDLEGAWSEP